MTTPFRSTLKALIAFAIAGAVVALPLGFLVWAGAEHGGRGLMTFPWTAGIGAALGIVVGAIVLTIRSLLRRAAGPRAA